jgi:hypothetical protein
VKSRSFLPRPGVCSGLVLFSLLLLFVPGARASKYAGAFMADGGGARALGVGSAFVAIADDASATFWNPAGAMSLSRRQVLAMHSERFGDLIDRDFASYVHPLRGEGNSWSDGAFGFSIIRLGIDDIAFTEHLKDALDTDHDGEISNEELLHLLDPEIQDKIEYKSDQEWGFLATYARALGAWHVGGNIKYVYQSVGQYSCNGIGVDLGVLRRDWWKRLDFGVKLQDITTTYLSWSTGRNEHIAPVVVPGLAYDWTFEKLYLDLLVAGAFETHFDDRRGVDQYDLGGNITANAYWGLEVTLSRRAHLRFGSHGGWDSTDLTYGLGLDLGPLKVDYALAGDVMDIDKNTHRVSVAVDF